MDWIESEPFGFGCPDCADVRGEGVRRRWLGVLEGLKLQLSLKRQGRPINARLSPGNPLLPATAGCGWMGWVLGGFSKMRILGFVALAGC
jgi:hypothetical protein